MSKITYSFLVLLYAVFSLSGQCPSGDIVFTTQAQVNQFNSLYPNCHRIKGSISIDYSNIIFLDSLYKIDTIDFGLAIRQNSALRSLEGLQNLKFIQDLTISENPLITNLKGLRSLKNANNSLGIYGMTALIDMTGVETLEYVRQLLISSCDKLTSLKGLSGLKSTYSFNIENNKALKTLNGVNTATTFGDHFEILYNPELQELPSFINMTQVYDIKIIGNPKLKSLNGLDALKTVWFLTIDSNDSLKNLDALSNLQTINFFAKIENNKTITQINGLSNVNAATIDSLIIFNNPNLNTCNNKMTCAYIAVPTNPVRISNNAPLCANRTAIFIQCSLVGNQDFAISDKLNIYPNPCNNLIHICDLPPSSNISILDQNLRRVLTRKSTESNLEIDTDQLANGLYYIVIKNEKLGIQKTSKLSIIH